MVRTFQRLYRDTAGPIYEADEKIAATVIGAMNASAASWDPFRVRFVMEDGSQVTVAPKRAAQ